MRSLRDNRGLTFVELFVVVALVAVITALAVPAYRSILFSVERTRMQGQMKMLMDDESLYERDHGTFYPGGTMMGSRSQAWEIFEPDKPMHLLGQNLTLPAGNRRYTFYIFRLTPDFPEPLILAYCHPFYDNDLDGDDWPDLWIKVGNSPPQLYADDLTNTLHTIEWN